MARSLLFVIALFIIDASLHAQATCFPVDEENFSNASGWTHVGTQTDVDITGGAMVWTGAHNAVYDRWWRPLDHAVADECFTASFKFTVGPNPSGSGVGADLFALTAGNLDPLNYDGSQGFAAVDQDGLMVVLSSVSNSNNDINDWSLVIEEKDGPDRYYAPAADQIFLNSSIDTYYAVFQRTSSTQVVLKVYTDEAHTNLYGTSVFGIHATVVGLNIMQAGVTTGGWGTRQFNGTLDEVSICDCNSGICFPVDEDSFADASGWTHVGDQQDVDITGGAVVWTGAHNAVYDRWWRPLDHAVADECFTASFKFTVGPNPSGSGVGADLFALTAGNLDPLNYDGSQGFAAVDQDGLVIVLSSVSNSDNYINNWSLLIEEKDGLNRYYPLAADQIFLNSSIDTYYAVFQRNSTTEVELNVYTDQAHANLFGTSLFGIHASVVGLNTLQAGVATAGWGTRQFNGTMDDVSICHCENTIGIAEHASTDALVLYPVPASDQLTIRFPADGAQAISRIEAIDIFGRSVLRAAYRPDMPVDVSALANGTYVLRLFDEHGAVVAAGRFVKE